MWVSCGPANRTLFAAVVITDVHSPCTRSQVRAPVHQPGRSLKPDGCCSTGVRPRRDALLWAPRCAAACTPPRTCTRQTTRRSRSCSPRWRSTACRRAASRATRTHVALLDTCRATAEPAAGRVFQRRCGTSAPAAVYPPSPDQTQALQRTVQSSVAPVVATRPHSVGAQEPVAARPRRP